MTNMELEEAVREALTVSAELATTLRDELEDLPRGSLACREIEVAVKLASGSKEVVRHMKRVVKLVQALMMQPRSLPNLSQQRGNSPFHKLHPQHDSILSDSSETAATARHRKESSSLAAPLNLERIHKSGGSSRLPKATRQLKVSKYTVRMSGGNPELPDGFNWRKYGEKVIHNAAYKRSYFRCAQKASRGCPAQKRVQKTENHIGFDVTYINEHTCGSESQSLIGMINNHADNYNYINSSSEMFTELNSRFLEDNYQSNANYARMPCNISTSSDNFLPSFHINNSHKQSSYFESLYNMASSSSSDYYPIPYDNSATINSSSDLLAASPIRIDYAEQMQTSCSNFDLIKSPSTSVIKVISNSSSTSELSSVCAPLDNITHQPLNYVLPEQEYMHHINTQKLQIGSNLSTEPDHQLTNSSFSNLFFDWGSS